MKEEISYKQNCIPAQDKDTMIVCPWCRGITHACETENDSYICSNCGTAISQDDLDNDKDQLN